MANESDSRGPNAPIDLTQKMRSRWLVWGGMAGGFVCLITILAIIIGVRILSVVYLTRGDTYRQQSQYDEAIAEYSKAIGFYPKFSDAYFGRGLSHYGNRDIDLALEDLDTAIEFQPNNPDYYYFRGLAYADIQEVDLAIADFDKAIEFQPNNPDYYYVRGLAYIAKQEVDLARSDFREVLRLATDPKMQQEAQLQLDIVEGILRLAYARTAFDKDGANTTSIFGAFDTIYVVHNLWNGVRGVVVSSNWYAENAEGVDPNFLIDTVEYIVTDATYNGTIYFYFEPPDDGWPKGAYRVEVFLEGVPSETVNFVVQ